MSAPYPGKAATFRMPIPGASSTLQSAEAMTRVGSSLRYYITNRAKAWWDPDEPVVVKDGGTPIVGVKVNPGGFVDLPAVPSGAVTCDVYTISMELVAGGYNWTASKKGAAIDTSTYPDIAGETKDKTYVGSGLAEWTGSVKRHFWYLLAKMTTAIGTSNAELTWTWVKNRNGNDESVKYESGGALGIVRDAGTKITTVTYVTMTTLASDVKAYVEADPTLSAMWALSYPAGNDGSGEVGNVATTPLTGGRDSLQQLATVAKQVLCAFYLEIATVAALRLEGVGIITDLTVTDDLEKIIETDLTFQGTGAFEPVSS